MLDSYSQSSSDVRLLVLDIDGTLVDESNRVRDNVLHAIRSVQGRGVAVALATGRMNQSSLPVYEALDSTSPLICYEGALIRQPQTGSVHRHWSIEPQTASQLLDRIETLKLNGRFSIHLYIQDDIYVSSLTDATIRYFEGSRVQPILVGDLRPLLDLGITKMILLSDDAQLIAELSNHLRDSKSRIEMKQHRSAAFLEAFHPDVNKKVAVRYLAEEIMSLRAENVMAIGDDGTDIEMLKYAGIGVAMGSAPPLVKASADWVTTTVEDDGVARAIERWILREQSTQRGSLETPSIPQ